MTLMPLDFVGLLCSTARSGSNAVLDTLKGVVPASYEMGKIVFPDDGHLIVSIRPQAEWPPGFLELDYDLTGTRFGAPVWLSRHDKIDQAISLAIAALSGRWYARQDYQADPVYDRDYIDQRLRQVLNHESEWDTFFKHGAGPVLRLWYEDHVRDDPTVAGRKILNWWGLDGDPIPPVERRHGDDLKAEWRYRYDNEFRS